tara:strand:+ start:1775 stop:1984 length:210 start_codon:yes stop_codon:yes gene_type:complete
MFNTNLEPKFNVGDEVKLIGRASEVDGFNYIYGKIIKIYKTGAEKYVNVVELSDFPTVAYAHLNDELSL